MLYCYLTGSATKHMLTMNKKKTRKEKSRPLHPRLSEIILTAEEENRQILSVSDFVAFYDITESYARKMISDLVETGWLVRVAKGKYQLLPARTGLDPFPMGDKFVVACQAYPDSFIAFGSAAEHHGLTLQVFPTVILASPDKSGSRTIGTTRVRLVKINARNYVGFEALNRGPEVKVATVERTVIDCINRPDLCGGISDLPEILKRARSKVNVERLLDCLATYGSKSLSKKVGYLLDYFGYELSQQADVELRQNNEGVKTYLFSPRIAGKSAIQHYSKKWRLVVNAPGFFEEVNEQEEQL